MVDAGAGTLPVGFEAYRASMQRVITAQGVGAGLGFRPRATDVLIAPFGKCGTTWLQQMVHSLRTGGDLDFDDISRVVPWIETAHDIGLDLDAPQRAEPRAYKSHLSWDRIPKGGRYIVSLRDPRDALVSMYRFMEGWFFEPGSVTIEEFARRRYLLREEGSDYWSHLLSWWSQRDNNALLLLAYEHMKQDLPGTVARVARFLGVGLDQATQAVAAEQASLASMSRNRNLYDDLLMREIAHARAGVPLGGDSHKVRAGAVGAHRQELPVDIAAEMDEIWRTVVTPVTGAPDYASLIAGIAPR